MGVWLTGGGAEREVTKGMHECWIEVAPVVKRESACVPRLLLFPLTANPFSSTHSPGPPPPGSVHPPSSTFKSPIVAPSPAPAPPPQLHYGPRT